MKKLIESIVLSLVSLSALAVEVKTDQVEALDTESTVLMGIAVLGILAGFCWYYFRRWDDEDEPQEPK